MDPISSPQNDRVKLVRLLQHQSKARRKHQRLVLEGVRLVRDVVENGIWPETVFYTELGTDDPAAQLIADLQAAGCACWPVTDAVMREMADTETPQGVVGVFPWPQLAPPESPELIVVADGWRDPGNLGTLIRTAAAAGVDLIALTPGTVDPFNPKTLRAGMGAQFRVPIQAHTWESLADLCASRAVYVADAGGTTSYLAVDWTQPSVVVIGGEAHGPRAALRDVPHTVVHIPMRAGAESLNAAVAASILMYAARAHTWR